MTDELTKRELPGLALLPPEPITTLRFLGHDVPTVDLPEKQRRFTIGAGACDVVVPRTLSKAISAVHASMERVGTGLLVRDLDSKNGTYASLRGPRGASFQVEPGDTFYLANVPVMVTDGYLEALRAHLCCHLGLLRDAAVDEALANVATGAPLLLLGDLGTGARRMASVIHATSAQRMNPRIMGTAPACLLEHAHGMTVFIDLEKLPPLPARYVKLLFDHAKGMRVIFAAPDERKARICLDHYCDRLRTIALTPLARRPEDVRHLLQFHWATELSATESVEVLGPEALQALEAYAWPRNLDELFEHSQRILEYQRYGGLRPAAAALGIRHQTLGEHLARIGFPIVPQAERELPLHPPRRLGRPKGSGKATTAAAARPAPR